MKCTCLSGFGNTGLPNCIAVFDVTKQLIFVPYFKDDGSINGIDLDNIAELDQAFLDGKVQALDPDERWYITPEIKNVADERGDDIMEEFEDSTSVFIQEGARTFNGIFIGTPAEFKRELDLFRCGKMGVYMIDKSGNLIGNNQREGFLDPIRIQDQSLSFGLVKGSDTTIQKMSIKFTIGQTMDDADLSMIESNNITGLLLGARGLVSVQKIAESAITVNGFTATLATTFGGVLSRTKAKGLAVTDFEAFNETASTAVVLTSVTEVTDGSYAFVYTTPVSSSDVIRVGNKTSGDLDKGYDVESFTITTP